MEAWGTRRRFSPPAPLGVLRCEVSGSDCPSQHHREVLHQELAAQRRFHGGELPGSGSRGGAARVAHLSSCSSLCALRPSRPDPGDGVPGPRGCAGRRCPLVGHPLGCTSRAAGVGAAGAAHVEGEAWGGWCQWWRGPPSGCGSHTHRPIYSEICVKHLPVCANISIRPWVFWG